MSALSAWHHDYAKTT